MGVTGLWTVVHPCARPVKIETLNKKRLAVDASIWIYQFLKAVRDKEGNALRNSHVVGFFRRICKLLFIGIKPVFVFDGGAPILKRQTITGRKQRREGRRDDAVRTAGKLLALQMQRRAEEEDQRRKDEVRRPSHTVNDEEELLPENLVYVDELQMTQQERQQNRKFKKKDAYHLPELDASLAEMGQPNDPRIMSLEELEQYAKQFNTGEDINVYDFSKIDFDSAFFTSLPASDRYNILNAARLRSRLRMGHSKEQLDTMFPDRMAFSKFQINRVKERNDLTQRLMHINSGNDALGYGSAEISRVAGEKGREYVLIKNDGVEGGWALGVVSNEGKQEQPIDVEKLNEPSDVDEVSEDDDFEDVPIEGLNRLPRKTQTQTADFDSVIARDLERRRALYRSRGGNANRKRKPRVRKDADTLFVGVESEAEEEEWKDVGLAAETNAQHENEYTEEDAELQRAIAMSLDQGTAAPGLAEEEDEYTEVFQQSKVEAPKPFSKGSGMAIAHMANNRAVKTASKPFLSDDSDDEIDLQAALAESRRTRHKRTSAKQQSNARPSFTKPNPKASITKAGGFDGPLPFEKLDLGSSLLGKKKMQKIAEDNAGGFEKEVEQPNKNNDAAPVPPWFAGDPEKDMAAQDALEAAERRRNKELAAKEFSFDTTKSMRNRDSPEIIDLDAPKSQSQEIIEIVSSGSSEDEKEEDVEMQDLPTLRDNLIMDDLAERIRAEPPKPLPRSSTTHHRVDTSSPAPEAAVETADNAMSEDEPLEWEDSDHEPEVQGSKQTVVQPVSGAIQPNTITVDADSEEEEFEDVELPVKQPTLAPVEEEFDPVQNGEQPTALPESNADVAPDLEDDEFDIYSDPEDEELFRSLAQEEEEHARFASTFNKRSTIDNAVEYERELRQLRNQQKKDRRDADEVTQTMVAECQQLLALFGLPYITAPMEAEAQCAELVQLGLVDGIITDDSDVFLFGGTRVYKNMFNQAKFVECYLTSDLEAEFGLSRHRLISIAQLLGSDYTEGLPGIGPVTALEIMSEFDTLPAFKEWWTSVQQGTRSKQDDASNEFRRKFRKNSTKVFLPSQFPDPRVEEAYLKPEVDHDPSGFVWGVPDLSALRAFLMTTIGWNDERTDEVLVPVIKDMNRREQEGIQANITQFFGGGVGAGAFAPRKRAEAGSKRLENALLKIGDRARRGDGPAEEENDQAVDGGDAAPAVSKGGKPNGKKSTKRTKEVASADDSEDESDLYAEPRKKTRKIAKGKAPKKRALAV
ncbi:PIN domain-like protein [Tothia fuscella]|uniref:PIN domain-like protein n=1 Tax=Tothia fuscella TaxID=1048955 RepID=A0A9P4TW35_9PEZI|nr:PIN domain-like protein [Tothia fuscella]